MKYRIVERNDGAYEIQSKKCYFFRWETITLGPFPSLDKAKRSLTCRILFDKAKIQRRHNMSIKRIVEEVEG